jgi:N-acetylglucosaminyl-diphospho-decaprenol L-rhamnosyltransferase
MALAPAPGEQRTPTIAPYRSTARRTRLAVAIVNFCQWRNAERLVRQLQRSVAMRDGDATIAVVDNASPDDPIADRLERLDGVSVHRNRKNEGFAAAVNRGAAVSDGDWLLLLNPDVSVPDGFLDDVLAAIDRTDRDNPRIGVVGFRLLDTDGSPQASAGPFPTFASTLAGLLRPRARRKCRHLADDRRHAVDWVTGGCLLVRADCFRDLDGLDERFFLYYEDVDFCRRAAAAGYAVSYDPSIAATHHSPLHGRQVSAPLRLVTRHALLAYADRYWSRRQRFLLRCLVRSEAALRGFAARLVGDRTGAICHRRIGAIARGPGREGIAEFAELLRPVAASHDLPA